MSYCVKCGAYIPDGDDMCPACGAAQGEAAAQAEARAEEKNRAGYYEYRESGEYHSGKYQTGKHQTGEHRKQTYYSGANPDVERYSSEYDADAAENRSLAYLCYLGVFMVIPYFMKPNSQFIRYHCNQGLILFIFSILLGVGSWFVPVVGWLIRPLGSLFALYCLITGLANVSKGKRSPLPLIGEISLIK